MPAAQMHASVRAGAHVVCQSAVSYVRWDQSRYFRKLFNILSIIIIINQNVVLLNNYFIPFYIFLLFYNILLILLYNLIFFVHTFSITKIFHLLDNLATYNNVFFIIMD